MSELNFDFSTVTETDINRGETNIARLEPGKHIVKVTEVKTGLSTQKQTPYVEISIADKDNKITSDTFYLSTTVKEGSIKSAFDISKVSLVAMVSAANGWDLEKSKTILTGCSSIEQLALKLSTALVGKPFAIRLTGEWVYPTDSSKQAWVKTKFASGKFCTTKDKLSDLAEVTPDNYKGKINNANTEEVKKTTSNVEWA